MKTVEIGQTKVELNISAYADRAPANELQLYAAGIKFFAYWFEKQDGSNGNDTEALFEEFKTNVCAAMAAGSQGNG